MTRSRRAPLLSLLALAASAGVVEAQADPRAAGQASVTGTVFNGVSRGVLAGATVQIVGTADSVQGRMYTTRTDSSGAFALHGIAPGSYVAGFFHPALDTLGLEGGTQAVDLHAGSQRLLLSSPTARTIIQQVCPGGFREDTTGLLIGHVLATGTNAPIAGASVSVEWGETIISRQGVHLRNREGDAESQAAGWFALCEVPSDVELTVRAASGFDSTGFVEVTVPRHGVRHLTMLVGGAHRELLNRAERPPTAADTAEDAPPLLTAWRGEAHLTGHVVDDRGQPLNNARAALLGSGLAASSNSNGYFSIDSLPGGTQSVEVRAVGYLPERVIVQLDPQRALTQEIQLTTPVTMLPTVAVRGTLLFSRNLASFERHRERSTGGVFLGPHDIERRPSGRFSNLLDGISGVHTLFNSGTMRIGMDTPSASGGAPIYCEPAIYVDGSRRHYEASDLEGLFYTEDIAGLEVYRRASETPIEFRDQGGKCGAIVVWTRPKVARPGERPPQS